MSTSLLHWFCIQRLYHIVVFGSGTVQSNCCVSNSFNGNIKHFCHFKKFMGLFLFSLWEWSQFNSNSSGSSLSQNTSKFSFFLSYLLFCYSRFLLLKGQVLPLCILSITLIMHSTFCLLEWLSSVLKPDHIRVIDSCLIIAPCFFFPWKISVLFLLLFWMFWIA